MTRLAIIGAGMAGLAAARALRRIRPELELVIFEQSSTLGGRVATGRRAGFSFDHGAQYAKAPTPELVRLLTQELPAGELIDIGLPVWVFDGAGSIAEGDAAQNADPKWTYRGGLDRLGALLGAGLDIRYEQPVARLEQGADAGRAGASAYTLFDAADRPLGTAELILLTPPAPQAAAILAASDCAPTIMPALREELASARYRRCISLALAYGRRIERPYYALVNTDRAHPISWLALEHAKGVQRCPPGQSLLIAQMAPQWSIDHWKAPHAQLEQQIAAQAGALLGEELGAPLWSDAQRWPYALPDSGADFARLNQSDSGLFFAGDYTAGQGRVHLAIESGWHAAAAIDSALPR